jgi:hypothetical protein
MPDGGPKDCSSVMDRNRRLLTRLMLAASLVASTAGNARAQSQDSPISVSAAIRTAFSHIAPEGADSTDEFHVESARLFLGGIVTRNIKMTFNAEYDGLAKEVRLMDAIGQFEFSPGFNIWMGRFLPPSDRANLYGPYYSNHWGIYTDGIQDGYPFIASGRSNGVAYWGQFKKISLSGGIFDGASATGSDTLIKAGRVEANFWETEPGYYRSGTFYGSKNILSIGVAGQIQGEEQNAVSVDFLLERKVGQGGAFTIESELARYDRLGGYKASYATDEGGYALASYLLPKLSGPGRFQVLAKFSTATYSNGVTAADQEYDQTTTELNLNYILSAYNARVMLFYLDTRFSAVQRDSKRLGVGLQLIK